MLVSRQPLSRSPASAAATPLLVSRSACSEEPNEAVMEHRAVRFDASKTVAITVSSFFVLSPSLHVGTSREPNGAGQGLGCGLWFILDDACMWH